MAEKLTSPRSGTKKVLETGVDLTILGLGINLVFGILDAMGHKIPESLQLQIGTFTMAAAGAVARWVRHRMVYGGKTSANRTPYSEEGPGS